MRKKHFVSLLLAITMLFSMNFNVIDVSANEINKDVQMDIELMWESVMVVYPILNYSGTTLIPSVLVDTYSTSVITSAKIIIQRKVGIFWFTYETYDINEVGSFFYQISCSGSSGSTYRIRFVGTVGQDSIDVYSSSVVLP